MFVIVFSILATALLIYLLLETFKSIKEEILKKSSEKYDQLCPDYWEVVKQTYDDNGVLNGVHCKNVHNLGKCGLTGDRVFKFEDDIFTDPETRNLARCRWSKNCEASWSGYDNLCA